jgi:hypothetical protein
MWFFISLCMPADVLNLAFSIKILESWAVGGLLRSKPVAEPLLTQRSSLIAWSWSPSCPDCSPDCHVTNAHAVLSQNRKKKFTKRERERGRKRGWVRECWCVCVSEEERERVCEWVRMLSSYCCTATKFKVSWCKCAARTYRTEKQDWNDARFHFVLRKKNWKKCSGGNCACKKSSSKKFHKLRGGSCDWTPFSWKNGLFSKTLQDYVSFDCVLLIK